jgi:sigma-B regulation protein RsbU (phosphoserine phosphatase)
MASARSALRAHALRETDIAALMAEVNQRLCDDTLPGEFVTALYAVLSADGRRLTYCNAGHEPLRLLRRGAVDVLDAGGLVLGIDPAACYETGTLDLEPGDLFVMATDGLIEALDYEDQEYGRVRWHDSIVRHGAASPALAVDLIAKQLLWDMRRFVGLARRDDDVSLVVGRVR